MVDGGTMENVSISNITMKNVSSTIRCPIFIILGNRARGPEGTPIGKIRNINISNLLVSGANLNYGSMILGLPGHPVENVKLSNIKIIQDGGGTKEYAKVIVPEDEKTYPMPTAFGDVMPSYAFFCRHVKGLKFHDVEVGFQEDDFRPALVCDDVQGLKHDGFEAEHMAEVMPIVLKNVQDIVKYDVRLRPRK